MREQAILAAAAIATVALLFVQKSHTAPQKIDEKTLTTVFAKEVKKELLADTLIFPARIEAKIDASILADADGVVTNIAAPLGKKVRVGQTLLTIKNIDPAYQYAPMKILAPVSGVVSQVSITVGSRVARGDKLLLLIDPTQLRANMEVPAQDVGLLTPGLQGEFRIPGESNFLLLKIKGISPGVDSTTGTALCELEIVEQGKKSASKSAEARLKFPGILGRASFQVNKRNGIMLQETAIDYRGREPFVRIVSHGVSHSRPVRLGLKSGGQVEILSGLKEGETVIERASSYVSEGEAVQIQNKL